MGFLVLEKILHPRMIWVHCSFKSASVSALDVHVTKEAIRTHKQRSIVGFVRTKREY